MVRLIICASLFARVASECRSWCGNENNPWERCCPWDKCIDCANCSGPTPAPSPLPAMETLKLLPDTTKCLDGSPAGYYHSLNAASEVWVIYMQGGGGCTNTTDCTKRSKNKLGSSTKWESTYEGVGASSRDCTFNPDFCEANHVYVRYCSGDSHRGQRTEQYNGFYIAGHNNFKVIVSDLLTHTPLATAKRVLLTGPSAGGVGTFANADTLTEMLPQAMVKASPIGGWFTPDSTEDHLDQPWVPVSFFDDFQAGKASDPTTWEAGWANQRQWFDAFISADCVAAEGGHCMNVPTEAAYMRTPVLIAENMWDKYQLEKMYGFTSSTQLLDDGQEWMVYYAKAMQVSTLLLGNKTGNGLFLPACIAHTGQIVSHNVIDGFHYFDVLGDWFFERNQLPHVLTDACDSFDSCQAKLLQQGDKCYTWTTVV